MWAGEEDKRCVTYGLEPFLGEGRSNAAEEPCCFFIIRVSPEAWHDAQQTRTPIFQFNLQHAGNCKL